MEELLDEIGFENRVLAAGVVFVRPSFLTGDL